MLDTLYKIATPWTAANKSQIFKNRVLGVIANYIYPLYCKMSPLADKQNLDVKNPHVVASLTTFPARIGRVHLCVQSIMRQSHPADKVILWLADSQFPNKDELPKELLQLESKGLEIRFCEDLRSYKKVFFTAQEYKKSIIITADDDTFYPESWIKGLLETANTYPDCVVCYRAHTMKVKDGKFAPYKEWDGLSPGVIGPSSMLIPIGVGGVLYPKGYFDDIEFNSDVVRRICPTADDLWLKVIGLKKGYKAVKVNAHSIEWFTIKSSQEQCLMQHNIGNNENDTALLNLTDYYKIF